MDDTKYEVHPRLTDPVEEAIEEVAAPEPVVAAPVVEPQSNADKNFRALREAKERAEQERDELARQLEEYKNTAPAPEVEEEFSVQDDEIIEGKQLKVLVKKIRDLKQQVNSYQQYSSANTVEARLRAQFPDFDTVLTKDNVNMLVAAYPEIANSIGASDDLYNKAVSTYTVIKKFGINTTTPQHEPEKEIAQRNAAKPRPLTSVSPQQGDSPLTRANAFEHGLTEDLKKTLYKEMLDAQKRV